MILGKLWRSFKAQANKLANRAQKSDPIAQMQYEYDAAVEQLKIGREGLAQYRALIERVTRQINNDSKRLASLEAKIAAYLKAGDRETASRFALERKNVEEQIAENESQLAMHEEAYANNLAKIKHSGSKLKELQNKITNYDAELKMSRAEAQMSELASSFNMEVTTDFGQIETMVQDQISLNRAKARVSADLSSEGVDNIEQQELIEQSLAEQALLEFESNAATVETVEAKRLTPPETA